MMSAVGDAVHVLPVINALKRANPRTRITWVLQPGPATLVRGHRSVDEIIIFDRARGLACVRRCAPRAGEAAVRPRDQPAGVLQGGNRHRVHATRRSSWDSTARARGISTGYSRTARFPRSTGAARAGSILRVPRPRSAFRREPVEWDLGPWPDERAWQREFIASVDRPVASIVVATSKPEKDWMPERWAEVADALYAALRDAGGARGRDSRSGSAPPSES